MEVVRIACKLCGIFIVIAICIPTNVFASLTKEQAEDVAVFATTFIEKGNERRDENGYPLLVYALSNNWKTSVEIRRSGYLGELYHVKNNNYHMKNGKYLDLGLKWCMDCGDFISYVYKTTLGLDMYLEESEDPWHIKDIYADANKYDNSEYFEFIYKNVSISKIDESKLEKGDIVVRMGSRENHGLIYVGEEMQAAHASRNAIKYSRNPTILGFEVVQFDRFYKKSTIVSIVRVKDGAVDIDKKVNSMIIWPDTGEKEDLFALEEKHNDLRACKVIAFEAYDVKNEKINGYNIEEFAENYKINEKYLRNTLKNSQTNINNIRQVMVDDKINEENRVENYLLVISKLNRDSNYFEKQIFDWIAHEIKRFLMQIADI